MEKLKNSISVSNSLLWQLLILITQFAMYLSVNWLDTYLNQPPPISTLDKFFERVVVPLTWLIYTLIAYRYSHKIVLAVIKGLLQTIVSYALVIGSVLAFYTWIG